MGENRLSTCEKNPEARPRSTVANCVVVMLPSSRCQFAVMVNCILASSSIRQPNIAQPTRSIGPQVFAGLDLNANDTLVRPCHKKAGPRLSHQL